METDIMSSSIPYDPRLVLGNIVNPEFLKKLKGIADLQAPVDAAQEELNSALLLRHKFGMMKNELADLDVGDDLNQELELLNQSIKSSAKEYASMATQNLPKIRAIRGTEAAVGDEWESPMDYNASNLKRMALAADSITLDAQYFSFDQNEQSSSSSMAAMSSHISMATSFLGSERSAAISASAQAQTSHQVEQHDILGTLVITANCTHKEASIFAPFVMDVDKAIRVWNEVFPDKKIEPDKPGNLLEIEEDGSATETLNLLSGATYGSSFVGMVHVLKESKSQSSQSMYTAAESLSAAMKVGGWFAEESGEFGVSSTFANSAKSLLSSQQISSHVSLVCMGVIPTIEANNVDIAVKQFTEFSPDKMMGQLATLQNATASEANSVQQAATSSKTGGKMMAIKAAEIKSVMSAVSEHQDGQNKMLDVNTLITSFTNFVNKAAEGKAGVPIEYFIKPIKRKQLAQMWVAKYFPGKFITPSGDDSNSGGNASPSPEPNSKD